MNPIARYTQKSFGDQRQYKLYIDTVQVIGRTIRGDFDTFIPLANLSPYIERRWSYNNRLLLTGTILATIGLTLLNIPVSESLDSGLYFSGISLAVPGGLMLLFNLRKIESVTFYNEMGVPVLGISRLGKESKEFDRFISAIILQIQNAKNDGLSPGDRT